MQKLFFFLLFITTTICCSAQTAIPGSLKDLLGLEPYTLADFNLKGPVKEVDEIQYTKKNGSGYNASGQLTMLFNEKGNLAEVKQPLLLNNILIGNKHNRYLYNEAGKLVAIEFLDASGTPEETTRFRYDPQGKLVAKEQVVDGKTDRKTLYEYDGKNQLVTTKAIVAGKERPASVYRYQYDTKGRVIACCMQSENDTTKYVYGYNDPQDFPFTYTVEGSLYDTYNEYAGRKKRYNDQGEMVSDQPYKPSGEEMQAKGTLHSYQYDAAKNWVKKTTTGFWEGYTNRSLVYDNNASAGNKKEAYAKQLQLATAQSLALTGLFLQSAMDKNTTPATLQSQLAAIGPQLGKDRQSLQQVPDIAGNKAKELTGGLLSYLQSPVVQADLKAIAENPVGTADKQGAVLFFIRTQLGKVKEEVAKLQ
jgi:hypothetical protein